MCEAINYIFGSLQTSEEAVKQIRKVLKRQSKINKRVATFALVVALYATVVEIHNKEQNRKIENINKELKELKHIEGE